MTKIKCTLGTIRQAIAEIEKYEKDLERKTRTLMERLAEVGIKEATIGFESAVYDGTNDVVVDQTPTWIGRNKLAIKASGSAITFIEFGTGVFNPGVHPKAADLGMVRGAYGHGRGQRETWAYKGDPSEAKAGGKVVREGGYSVILTRGNDPNRSMYDAGKEMRAQVVRIAREVFDD